MHWFCFTLPYDWSKKLRLSPTGDLMHNLHRSRLGHLRFPALQTVACFYFEFCQLFRVFLFVLIGFCNNELFRFYYTQSNSALMRVSDSRYFFRGIVFSDLIKLKVEVSQIVKGMCGFYLQFSVQDCSYAAEYAVIVSAIGNPDPLVNVPRSSMIVHSSCTTLLPSGRNEKYEAYNVTGHLHQPMLVDR